MTKKSLENIALDQEFGINRYTLLSIRQINNKDIQKQCFGDV